MEIAIGRPLSEFGKRKIKIDIFREYSLGYIPVIFIFMIIVVYMFGVVIILLIYRTVQNLGYFERLHAFFSSNPFFKEVYLNILRNILFRVSFVGSIAVVLILINTRTVYLECSLRTALLVYLGFLIFSVF